MFRFTTYTASCSPEAGVAAAEPASHSDCAALVPLAEVSLMKRPASRGRAGVASRPQHAGALSIPLASVAIFVLRFDREGGALLR